MSLTRNEWLQVWQEIKNIERINNLDALEPSVSVQTRRRNIDTSVGKIKEKIQQVIGQLE